VEFNCVTRSEIKWKRAEWSSTRVDWSQRVQSGVQHKWIEVEEYIVEFNRSGLKWKGTEWSSTLNRRRLKCKSTERSSTGVDWSIRVQSGVQQNWIEVEKYRVEFNRSELKCKSTEWSSTGVYWSEREQNGVEWRNEEMGKFQWYTVDLFPAYEVPVIVYCIDVKRTLKGIMYSSTVCQISRPPRGAGPLKYTTGDLYTAYYLFSFKYHFYIPGPSTWANTYPTCAGKSQSPIGKEEQLHLSWNLAILWFYSSHWFAFGRENLSLL
jgi:hypothetical protein